MEIKERQLEIIEAAGEILTESGIAGLTTKNLAAIQAYIDIEYKKGLTPLRDYSFFACSGCRC